jgi:hypothetical protein
MCKNETTLYWQDKSWLCKTNFHSSNFWTNCKLYQVNIEYSIQTRDNATKSRSPSDLNAEPTIHRTPTQIVWIKRRTCVVQEIFRPKHVSNCTFEDGAGGVGLRLHVGWRGMIRLVDDFLHWPMHRRKFSASTKALVEQKQKLSRCFIVTYAADKRWRCVLSVRCIKPDVHASTISPSRTSAYAFLCSRPEPYPDF